MTIEIRASVTMLAQRLADRVNYYAATKNYDAVRSFVLTFPEDLAEIKDLLSPEVQELLTNAQQVESMDENFLLSAFQRETERFAAYEKMVEHGLIDPTVAAEKMQAIEQHGNMLLKLAGR